jgi:hypothetical protein
MEIGAARMPPLFFGSSLVRIANDDYFFDNSSGA